MMSISKRMVSSLPRLSAVAGGAAAGLLAALPAFAEDAPAAPVATLNSGDTAWMLVSTAFVLMMTIPGLALFYGGMVRKKNVLAIMAQSFAICCFVSVLWMVVGYSLTFGTGNAFIGDFSKAFLSGIGIDALSGTIPEALFLAFQMTFAVITPALITGAFADRMKFSAMLVFSLVWVLVVYVPVAHWVWGGGFLMNEGVLDFAGGTVVHINAGVAGLVAAIVLGKRKGYGTENMAPHNLTLSVVGAALLWVGWFGFNAGSALTAGGLAAMALLVTHIAASAAAVSWTLVEWIFRGKPSVLGIISGAVGGLVAITPAAGFVTPTGALIIGLLAGVACFWGAVWLKHKLGYDDSLDAFGVHGIGGLVGAVLTGVFAASAIGGKTGLLEGNAGQVVTQIYGVVATVVWCAVATFIILKVLDMIMGIRVSPEEETEGLDLAEHGETIH
ncbi:ammonium transporter [Novispirillum itersonii]|uniref:Ammonium transporter n=1 Tax=Novispirillum itersonii TaxID=189 RepID=A0A7X0DNL6_NOVIT|nr:ammonium transporter [Novispirillum itersonii]MBB6211504.1 Amt family ammonium transporter [Novispirillum itersonii]